MIIQVALAMFDVREMDEVWGPKNLGNNHMDYLASRLTMKSRRRCATKTGDGWWWLLAITIMMCIPSRKSVYLKQRLIPIPTGDIMLNLCKHNRTWGCSQRENNANQIECSQQSITMLARLSCSHSIYLRHCRTKYIVWSKTEMLTASWKGHWNNTADGQPST